MLDEFDIEASGIYRRGEPRRSLRPDGRVYDSSGFNFTISDAGFREFEQQLTEAIEFLNARTDLLRAMRLFPGVESAVLDFGIAWKDTATQTDRFPEELIRLSGEIGVAIEVSHYPVSSESNNDD